MKQSTLQNITASINIKELIQLQQEIHKKDANKNLHQLLKNLSGNFRVFYKNSGGKFGVSPRCKPCVNEDNKRSHERRLQKNPEHVKSLASARSKKHYHQNLELSRERARKSAAKARKDPLKLEKFEHANELVVRV
jgi:hypothetical protein